LRERRAHADIEEHAAGCRGPAAAANTSHSALLPSFLARAEDLDHGDARGPSVSMKLADQPPERLFLPLASAGT
jgi:hypothetical protein